MSVAACDKFFREKMTQVARVAEEKYLDAISEALAWGRMNLPEVTARCDIEAEEQLTALRNNGLIDDFKPVALDYCRARLELYKGHAMALEATI